MKRTASNEDGQNKGSHKGLNRRREQQRLYLYVQENPTPRKIGLLFGLELGLRIGDICGLQWGDFDLKLGTLKINRTVCRISCGSGHTKVVIQTPKTRTSRREIPLPKQLLILLNKIFIEPLA